MIGGWTPSAPALDWLTAGGILLAFIVATALMRALWARILHPYTHHIDGELGEVIYTATRTLATWSLLLTGIFTSGNSLAIVGSHTRYSNLLGRSVGVVWVAVAVWAALRLFYGLTSWYVAKTMERSGGARDITHQAGVIRKLVAIFVVAIGALYMLRIAGADITPLLASGAIGGLAAALALQDTLSNLFAGFFLAIDRPVKVGDFIKLEHGEEGFVQEIGWRNTKVRPWANNLVVIPNSKLSQSIITNYYLPRQEMSVPVPCSVSYDSDLQHVEQVALAVAREVMQRVKGADAGWQPVVRWKEFGDFAIAFNTTLRVHEFGAQYELQSEFIKALHRRFGEEGIEIPSPAPRLVVVGSDHPTGVRRAA